MTSLALGLCTAVRISRLSAAFFFVLVLISSQSASNGPNQKICHLDYLLHHIVMFSQSEIY